MDNSVEEPVDPHSFDSDLDVAVAALYNMSQESSKSWFSALDISHQLRDEHGIRLHWRTIDSLFRNNREVAHSRKRNNRWQYFLLKEGKSRVTAPDQSIKLIDPGQTLEAVVSLHDLLGDRKGGVRICDPYLDPKTVEHLDALPDTAAIFLLTQTVRDSGKLRRVVSALRADKSKFEIRTVASSKIHDRYLIDDDEMVILGTSLNGFGKKQSFVIKAGEDFRNAMLKEFNRLWGDGNQWP